MARSDGTLITGAKIVFWAFILGIIIEFLNWRGIHTGNYIPALTSAYYILTFVSLIGVLMLGYALYLKR